MADIAEINGNLQRIGRTAEDITAHLTNGNITPAQIRHENHRLAGLIVDLADVLSTIFTGLDGRVGELEGVVFPEPFEPNDGDTLDGPDPWDDDPLLNGLQGGH
jgi:hypothetical protein